MLKDVVNAPGKYGHDSTEQVLSASWGNAKNILWLSLTKTGMKKLEMKQIKLFNFCYLNFFKPARIVYNRIHGYNPGVGCSKVG